MLIVVIIKVGGRARNSRDEAIVFVLSWGESVLVCFDEQSSWIVRFELCRLEGNEDLMEKPARVFLGEDGLQRGIGRRML